VPGTDRPPTAALQLLAMVGVAALYFAAAKLGDRKSTRLNSSHRT